jgi:hypothetical protein
MVVFGNHSSVLVPRQDRESIRKCYCVARGGKVMKADPERDFVRLGEDFYIGFLHADVTDESEFLRSFRALAGNQVRQRGGNEPKTRRVRSRREA